MKEDYEVGSLINFKDMSKEEIELLIQLLSKENSYLFRVLFNLLGDDLALELIDILADRKISFPSRKKIYKTIEKVKIYTFIKSKDESQESYKLLSKQYDKRISMLKSIVERIDETIS